MTDFLADICVRWSESQRAAVFGVKFYTHPIFPDITLQNLCFQNNKKQLFGVEGDGRMCTHTSNSYHTKQQLQRKFESFLNVDDAA